MGPIGVKVEDTKFELSKERFFSKGLGVKKTFFPMLLRVWLWLRFGRDKLLIAEQEDDG